MDTRCVVSATHLWFGAFVSIGFTEGRRWVTAILVAAAVLVGWLVESREERDHSLIGRQKAEQPPSSRPTLALVSTLAAVGAALALVGVVVDVLVGLPSAGAVARILVAGVALMFFVGLVLTTLGPWVAAGTRSVSRRRRSGSDRTDPPEPAR